MAQYGRVYRDDIEKELRFQIFKENLEFIESFNANTSKSYTLNINEFADQTNEEFMASRNGFKPRKTRGASETSSFMFDNVDAVPSSMDWRKKGAVTPIKNQGQCGIYVSLPHILHLFFLLKV